jgi:signal transduction histidine kinase
MEQSARVAAVVARGRVRQARERRALRLLGLPLLLVVVIPSLAARPRVATHGAGLVVGLAVIVLVASFAVVVARAPRLDRGEGGLAPTVSATIVMAAAGVVLIARQPAGTGELALSLVAWVAGSRLPLRAGVALVAVAAGASAVAYAAAGSHPVTGIGSTLLLAALLFLMARLYRRAEADRERAEVAAAALEDARERELQMAAIAERSRIARELHDVLAHSLSGLSLQLEAARLTAEREGAGARLVETLARCRRLAAQGLEDARRAVRALRGDDVPGVAELADLVEGFRQTGLDIGFTVHGDRRDVSPEAGLAVYRAAQEALTNVARHSGAGHADVELRLGDGRLLLVVTDDGGGRGPASPALALAGSGYGLSAMRERAELLGGRVAAGPVDGGFRVELELPA